jgi:hypothetical protein
MGEGNLKILAFPWTDEMASKEDLYQPHKIIKDAIDDRKRAPDL